MGCLILYFMHFIGSNPWIMQAIYGLLCKAGIYGLHRAIHGLSGSVLSNNLFIYSVSCCVTGWLKQLLGLHNPVLSNVSMLDHCILISMKQCSRQSSNLLEQ